MDTASEDSVPFGYGASAFGSENGDEPEGTPQRGLELPSDTPVNEGARYDVARAQSPPHSYTSMQSNEQQEMEEEHQAPKLLLHRRDSCCFSSDSADSDDSMEAEARAERRAHTPDTAPPLDPPLNPELLLDPSEVLHPAFTVEFTFKAIQSTLEKLGAEELKAFKRRIQTYNLERFQEPLENMVDLVDKVLEVYGVQSSLQLTDLLLKKMNLRRSVEYLQRLRKRQIARHALKETLRRKYERMSEGSAQPGLQGLFESIFTELHIVDGANSSVNCEHEYRVIEDLVEQKRGKDEPFTCRQIFNPEIVKNRHIRSVLMKGVAGVGKSVAVQRFILDWATGEAHQDIFFLLPLPFRELNPLRDSQLSFMELLHSFYPEMKEVDRLDIEDCKVLIVCDGLDTSVMGLNFHQTEYWCDPNEPNTGRVLVTNLMRGNLLHSAYLWVTSRPLAASLVPAERVHQVLEVRGFNPDQREAYFRKHIGDTELAERVVAHVRSCKMLYIMCHLPLFCHIACSVLQREVQAIAPGAVVPRAITHLYTHLLVWLMGSHAQRRQPGIQAAEGEFLMNLGRLAFCLLERGQFRIEEEQWAEFRLDPRQAVVETGLCSEFFREKFIMYQEKVHCFLHPSMQEYMAALYVFFSFQNHGKNVLDGQSGRRKPAKGQTMADLYKSAVNRALSNDSCHYDLFLRFLLGLSAPANQQLLQGLSSKPATNLAQEDIAGLLRQMMNDSHSPQRLETLQRCLDELFCSQT